MWDENLQKETKYRQLLTHLEVEEKKSSRKEITAYHMTHLKYCGHSPYKIILI